MLHQFQRIAEDWSQLRHRSRSIPQRPQEINKKALNQAEVVVAFHDGATGAKALTYWLRPRCRCRAAARRPYPMLELFIWSPQWLKVARVFEILPIETGDTSRTPTVGGGSLHRHALDYRCAANLLTEDERSAIEKAEATTRSSFARASRSWRSLPGQGQVLLPQPRRLSWCRRSTGARSEELVLRAGSLTGSAKRASSRSWRWQTA